MSTATATKIRIQAREVIRYANRNGLTLRRFAVSGPNQCARGVIRHMVDPTLSMYDTAVNEAVGMTFEEMDSLEQGFDYGADERNEKFAPSLKYFKIGQNIARLAGLAS